MTVFNILREYIFSFTEVFCRKDWRNLAEVRYLYRLIRTPYVTLDRIYLIYPGYLSASANSWCNHFTRLVSPYLMLEYST